MKKFKKTYQCLVERNFEVMVNRETRFGRIQAECSGKMKIVESDVPVLYIDADPNFILKNIQNSRDYKLKNVEVEIDLK